MKQLVNLLKYVAPLVVHTLFLLWRKATKQKGTAASLIIIFVLTGCFQHYFRTNTKTSVDETTLNILQTSNKYFIIHFSDNRISGVSNVAVSSDKLTGSMADLPDEHYKYINPLTKRANRVDKKDKPTALLEVHLYTTDSSGNTNGFSLPLSSFNRMDVYTFDENRTRISHIISAVTLAATIGFVIVVGSAGAGLGGL